MNKIEKIDEIYKKKYIEYKRKYLELKNNENYIKGGNYKPNILNINDYNKLKEHKIQILNFFDKNNDKYLNIFNEFKTFNEFFTFYNQIKDKLSYFDEKNKQDNEIINLINNQFILSFEKINKKEKIKYDNKEYLLINKNSAINYYNNKLLCPNEDEIIFNRYIQINRINTLYNFEEDLLNKFKFQSGRCNNYLYFTICDKDNLQYKYSSKEKQKTNFINICSNLNKYIKYENDDLIYPFIDGEKDIYKKIFDIINEKIRYLYNNNKTYIKINEKKYYELINNINLENKNDLIKIKNNIIKFLNINKIKNKDLNEYFIKIIDEVIKYFIENFNYQKKIFGNNINQILNINNFYLCLYEFYNDIIFYLLSFYLDYYIYNKYIKIKNKEEIKTYEIKKIYENKIKKLNIDKLINSNFNKIYNSFINLLQLKKDFIILNNPNLFLKSFDINYHINYLFNYTFIRKDIIQYITYSFFIYICNYYKDIIDVNFNIENINIFDYVINIRINIDKNKYNQLIKSNKLKIYNTEQCFNYKKGAYIIYYNNDYKYVVISPDAIKLLNNYLTINIEY